MNLYSAKLSKEKQKIVDYLEADGWEKIIDNVNDIITYYKTINGVVNTVKWEHYPRNRFWFGLYGCGYHRSGYLEKFSDFKGCLNRTIKFWE